MSANLAAFLSMLSHSEGTDRVAQSYRCCYGFIHTIIDLRDHPALTGEWHGESLANLGPAYAGLVSTAAGRYQITKATWMGCKAALNLPDFEPASQDQAATLLIRQHQALDLIEQGNLAGAVSRCASTWASLPGSLSGQPKRDMATLTQAYTQAGGMLA